ncbi:MAG: VIT domain-containing protein [Thiohalomonadaceae bacterium]
MTTQHVERTWKSLVLGLVLFAGSAEAAGLLTPVDGSLPPLDIRDHHVEVTVEDGYAITRVEQVFHNPHDRDLEAIYSFPVPERGAVAEFTVWIDGRPVNGEVVEKQRAREIYEQEKQAGRDVGLTEKDSYKTFDIHVSPVRAGQDTRLRLVYMQPAHIDSNIGRYVYPLEEGGVDERRLAFWTANEKVSGSFRFDLKLRSAYPVEAVMVPNGNAAVKQLNANEWQVTTEAGAPVEGGAAQGAVYTLDKDLVVYWRHPANLPGSVDLVAHKPEGAKEGTFMLVLTPGDDLKPITEGRDFVFVLDMSGSMSGRKYETLAKGVSKALARLRPVDRFRIVLFNERARELTGGYESATPEAIARFTRELVSVQPNDGTNLYAGLAEAIDALDADRTSAIVLVTDGVANVGETAQKRFIELVKRKDVRLYTFIMGNSASRPLLDALVRHSGGFGASVSNDDDIVGHLLMAESKVSHEALHGVKIAIDGVRVSDLTPADLGSLYRGQQLVVFGHYTGGGEADVRLTGKISGQPKEYRTRFHFPQTATENPEIERLWAYAAVEDHMDAMRDFGEDADRRAQVLELGVEYGLVTEYTSMLVLREEQFAAHGIDRKNRDRLANEHQAQQQRAAQAPTSRRVDTAAPMFSGNRAWLGSGSGGGGAFDLWVLLALLPFAWMSGRLVKSEWDA